MADDPQAEIDRLTEALVALEREHHALLVRYRRAIDERDWAREQARVFRRAILRAAREQAQED